MKCWIKGVLLICLTMLVTGSAGYYVVNDRYIRPGKVKIFRLLEPNLNYTAQQQDVHILQFYDAEGRSSRVIMIDTGMEAQARERLVSYLRDNQFLNIDEIFITHPHKDHYGGLYALIDSGISIGKVWMNLPDKLVCDREIPWGCDYSDLLNVIKTVKSRNVPVEELHHANVNQHRVLYQDRYSTLTLLFAGKSDVPGLGSVDINDLSLIMDLQVNGTRYLFTGDLNRPLSRYLARTEQGLKVDVLKVPHHGTEGTAHNEFFDKVAARVAIVPSPRDLWCSERSARIRNYFTDHGTEIYVSGFNGDMVFNHYANGKLKIRAEHGGYEICVSATQ